MWRAQEALVFDLLLCDVLQFVLQFLDRRQTAFQFFRQSSCQLIFRDTVALYLKTRNTALQATLL
jgi:hypothetical protein